MRFIGRLLRIALGVGGFLGWWGLWRLHLLRAPQSPAERLRQTLERLGTTFIKLGQGLSLRRELFPSDVLEAFQGLQDRAAPFPSERAISEVERALGRPLGEVFAQFNFTPLAAASIAQVHQARLHDGREVIVKIRRPGIQAQVSLDMRVLRMVLRIALLLAPRLRPLRPMDLVAEIEANLRKEMNFRQEGRNIARFVEIFRGSREVYVPEAIAGFVTESVMVQEFSTGIRVDDSSLRKRGPELAQTLIDAYLRQFFTAGVFHGDPHPGNLFVLPDGRLCFHDFGLIGQLSLAQRRNLAAFMQAFIYQDGGWLLDAFLGLGILQGNLDRSQFRLGLDAVLQDFASLPLSEWSLAEAFLRVARLGSGQNIRMPHNLLVMLRAMSLLEGVVRSLDPNYNLLEGLAGRAAEVTRQVLQDRASGAAKARLWFEVAAMANDAPIALLRLLQAIRVEDPMRPWRQGLEGFEGHVDRASNRMAFALVTFGLYIASALLMQHSLGPRVGGVPLLAILGFGLALWFTWRLAVGIARSGHL